MISSIPTFRVRNKPGVGLSSAEELSVLLWKVCAFSSLPTRLTLLLNNRMESCYIQYTSSKISVMLSCEVPIGFGRTARLVSRSFT